MDSTTHAAMWTMLAMALVSAAILTVKNRQRGSFASSRGTLSAFRGPAFPGLRMSLGPYLVDKTAVIEKIVKTGLYQRVDLVLRPRRCGKSCMLHMLR
jgi:Predicted AAA-ATPase